MAIGKLAGKVIAVTGGEGLLGRKFVECARAEGAMALSLDLHEPESESDEKIRCDITDSGSIKRALDFIKSKHGKIDGWVNNAYPRTSDWGASFEAIPEESWSKNVEMHLNGYFRCCQAVLPQMKVQGSGTLVNIGSIYGLVANDPGIYEGTSMGGEATYTAIKGGIIQLTRFLAVEYARAGVRVNCLSPGGVFDHQAERFVANYNKRAPIGRMAEPADIAMPLVFLLSDDSKYVIGQNLVVDGGWTAI